MTFFTIYLAIGLLSVAAITIHDIYTKKLIRIWASDIIYMIVASAFWPVFWFAIISNRAKDFVIWQDKK